LTALDSVRSFDDSLHTQTSSGCLSHWWMAIIAIPSSRESRGYARLRRVWNDPTRFAGPAKQNAASERKYREKRKHEFVDPTHETSLTASVFENFELIPPSRWVSSLCEEARSPMVPKDVVDVRWSYEWSAQIERDGAISERLCDVVIHYRTADSELGIIVIEAKNIGKTLGTKDTDSSYYLDISAFSEQASNVQLIYCVDGAKESDIRRQLGATKQPWGLLTWQRLAGLQIALARALPVDPAIRRFLAGSIQQQFCQRNILPDRLACDYLDKEPSLYEIDALGEEDKQPGGERTEMLWRLEK
jgi:hypothetical protein